MKKGQTLVFFFVDDDDLDGDGNAADDKTGLESSILSIGDIKIIYLLKC